MYMYRTGAAKRCYLLTEVEDGARILRRHVEELEYLGEIDEERAGRLRDDIDQLQRRIERHYEDPE